MPEFQAILFDFDGVLVDSEPVHCDCWREVLAPLGVPVTWELYAAHCVGAVDSKMVEVFAKLADPPADPAKLWERYPLKKQLFRERMAAHAPFAAGVAEFFRELSAQYKLGVVSSSSHAEIEPFLEAAGIRQYLGTVVGGDDVKRHKPAPDPYVLAGERLGIQTALAVEDSAPGIESARAAGFTALQIADPARMMELVRTRLDGIVVVGICGSLRPGSYTRMAVNVALRGAAEAGARTQLLDLAEYSLGFAGRDDGTAPESVAMLRRQVREADGIVLGTPEYHGSFSGVLKNALDLMGFTEFEGKMVGLVGVSGGKMGAFDALNGLRNVGRALHAWVVPEQASVPEAWKAFDESGQAKDTEAAERLFRVGRQVARFARLHKCAEAAEFLKDWEAAPVNPGGE